MPSSSLPDPPRLIDLRINWFAQYAAETNVFGIGPRERVGRDLGRIEGYLGATSAALLMLGLDTQDWATHSDPWAALGELIARAEAEFSGRLILGREDVTRWRDDPQGLTWGVLGVAGFDALIRSAQDLERLSSLFTRGVRVFQPTTGRRDFEAFVRPLLEALMQCNDSSRGPMPCVDLTGMGPTTMAATLDWFEADAERPRRVIPFRSHGPFDEAAARLWTLGGFVGLGVSRSSFESLEALQRGIESSDASVGLATEILEGGAALPGIETVPALQRWAVATFGAEKARAVLRGNAENWIARFAIG